MMSPKKLSEIRAEVQAAYAPAALDPGPWLEQQIRKLQGQQPPNPRAVETLQLLRRALAEDAQVPPKQARKRRSSG